MLNTFKVYFYVFIRPIIKTLLKQSDIRKFSFYQVSQDVNWRHLKHGLQAMWSVLHSSTTSSQALRAY